MTSRSWWLCLTFIVATIHTDLIMVCAWNIEILADWLSASEIGHCVVPRHVLITILLAPFCGFFLYVWYFDIISWCIFVAGNFKMACAVFIYVLVSCHSLGNMQFINIDGNFWNRILIRKLFDVGLLNLDVCLVILSIRIFFMAFLSRQASFLLLTMIIYCNGLMVLYLFWFHILINYQEFKITQSYWNYWNSTMI